MQPLPFLLLLLLLLLRLLPLLLFLPPTGAFLRGKNTMVGSLTILAIFPESLQIPTQRWSSALKALANTGIRSGMVDIQVILCAYHVLRTFKCPRSDANNISTTLIKLRDRHNLTFGYDQFPAQGQWSAMSTHSCTLEQTLELIMVLPGEDAA